MYKDCCVKRGRDLKYKSKTASKLYNYITIFIISRGAEGPGREILQRPPSVRPSVCLSVCPSRLVFAL